MKVSFLSFVLLATLFSGCQGTATVENPVVDPVETTDPVNTSAYSELELYTSEAFGLSFRVPEGMVVTEFSEFLVVDTVDRTGFEGELLDVLRISVKDESLEEALNAAEESHNLSVAAASSELTAEKKLFKTATVNYGEKTYTQAFMYSSFGDTSYSINFRESNGRTVAMTVDGSPEKVQDSASLILETLEF